MYVALDAALQEDAVDTPVPLEDMARIATPPSRIAPDPQALAELARELCGARHPLMVLGYPGRAPECFDVLVELAELVGIGAVETHWRLNFPNRHPLNVTGSDALEDADLVLFVDTKDMGKPTQQLESTTRTITSRLPHGCRVVDLGFGDVGISSWSEDYAEALPADLRVTADTAVALPLLLEECRRLVAQDDAGRIAERGRAPRRPACPPREDVERLGREGREGGRPVARLDGPPRRRGVGGREGPRLGADRRHRRRVGAAHLGLRPAAPPSR